MKAKKLISLLLAAVCLCVFLAACGKTNEPEKPAADTLNVKTVGEAMAMVEDGSAQTGTYDKYFVYVFEKDGTYWRLTSELTDEQSAALWELDVLDDDYNAKLAELTAPLPVTKCENLSEKKLTDDELTALAGKTGEDLLNDGWISGTGYNLDTMEFFMEYPPFAYTVVFEAQEKLENTDDFDEEEAIRPLKAVSVKFDGLGGSATDLPEEYAEQPDNGAEDDAEASGVDYLVLVNKQNQLPEGWEETVVLEDAQNVIPEGVELNEDNEYLATDVFKVEPGALAAFRALQADLEADGIVILLDSTYRSVARQEELWSEFEEEYGLEYTQNTVAVPGTSEHHTGLAIDVCIVKDGKIINENDDMIAEREIFAKIHAKLADYGFILRFPEGAKEITGYDYEPWHFRYVDSAEIAHEIMDNGLTLEEYLAA